VFLDEAGNLKPLAARLNLENLRGSSAAPPARRVQEKILSNAKRLVSQNAAVPGNQLTGAKVSILKRLESALGNRKSAEAIFVSEGTLKWHLHNVYGKRDVKTPRLLLRARVNLTRIEQTDCDAGGSPTLPPEAHGPPVTAG
jgi:LuxR family maltose regulon positive regulatory protein